MHTDFFSWLEQHRGREYDLHSEHINPAFVKVLRPSFLVNRTPKKKAVVIEQRAAVAG